MLSADVDIFASRYLMLSWSWAAERFQKWGGTLTCPSLFSLLWSSSVPVDIIGIFT